jgi:uncharacterized membrane protein YphA (DoxX/SURF4 family)
MNKALWVVQVLVGLLFVFAGGSKLVMSAEQLTQVQAGQAVTFSIAFLRFIGVCELLGGLGLILPGLLRIRPGLTPLAAAGLIVIMIGATASTLANGMVGPSVIPAVVGALCAFVAYARWKVAPLRA